MKSQLTWAAIGVAIYAAFSYFRDNPVVPWSGLMTDRSMLEVGLIPVVIMLTVLSHHHLIAPRLLLRRHRWIEDVARQNRELTAQLETDKAALVADRQDFERERADWRTGIDAMIEDAQATIKRMRAEDEVRRQTMDREIQARQAKADQLLSSASEAQAKLQELDARDRAANQKATGLDRREQALRPQEAVLAEQNKVIQDQLTEAGETLASAKRRAAVILDQAEQAAKQILARAEKTKAQDAPSSECLLVLDFVGRKGNQVRRQDLLSSKLLTGSSAYDRVLDSLLRAGRLACDDSPVKKNDWIYTLISAS